MLFNFAVKHLSAYTSPVSLNSSWGFGSSLGVFMVFQSLVGVLLAMFYKPTAKAFSEIIYLVNEITNGYLLKYLHLNGASLIFILLYLHTTKAIFYASFRTLGWVWVSGVALLLLSIVTAFLGYSLPYGQMSYWAATVITNLLTAIYCIGEKILVGVHGAFAVQEQTIARFFVLHFILALAILALAAAHILILHANSSTSSDARLNGWAGSGGFSYLFFYKDLQIISAFFLVLLYLSLVTPNYLNHTDNFIEANPLVTPTHIVPEWYFLTFYAMLRAVPYKLGGVLVLLASIGFLASLPITAKISNKNDHTFVDFRAVELHAYFFVFIGVMLAYMGSQEAVQPFILASQLLALFYFGVLVLRLGGVVAGVGLGTGNFAQICKDTKSGAKNRPANTHNEQ